MWRGASDGQQEHRLLLLGNEPIMEKLKPADQYTQEETVRVLVNLDIMAGEIPGRRRAWDHLFIACGLIQDELPDPELLTRERFMELAGKVHDKIYSALASGKGPCA